MKLNDNLGMPIRVNKETGNPEWKDVGADTWNPFSSDRPFTMVIQTTAYVQWWEQEAGWRSSSSTGKVTIKRLPDKTITYTINSNPQTGVGINTNDRVKNIYLYPLNSIQIVSFEWDD